MTELSSPWNKPNAREYKGISQERVGAHHTPTMPTESDDFSKGQEGGSFGLETGVWLNADLYQRDTTAKLDDQDPVTLYYLGRVTKIDEVVEVYVDKKQSGEIKHWAVIESRNFDIMDRIYDIELDTRDKFPYADVDFRVTVYTEDGPSAAHSSMKIYDTR